MTLWERLQSLIDEARKKTLGAVIDALAEGKARRDSAAFSIALIALSAKMARADGFVSPDETAAFRSFFQYPAREADKVRMIYNLAQQDVAGFDAYVDRVARLFRDEPQILEDVLDCLFHVASADGVEHPRERALLEMAAARFAVDASALRRLRAVHLGLDADDPFSILGVDADASAGEIREAYLALVRAHHPDALIARGVPEGLIAIGNARMAAINDAYKKASSLAR